MKSLRQSITEGILDNIDNTLSNGDKYIDINLFSILKATNADEFEVMCDILSKIIINESPKSYEYGKILKNDKSYITILKQDNYSIICFVDKYPIEFNEYADDAFYCMYWDVTHNKVTIELDTSGNAFIECVDFYANNGMSEIYEMPKSLIKSMKAAVKKVK